MGGIFLYTKTSMFGWFPIQNSIGGVLHPPFFSKLVGKDWGRIFYPIQSKDEWGNLQYSDPCHQWGKRE